MCCGKSVSAFMFEGLEEISNGGSILLASGYLPLIGQVNSGIMQSSKIGWRIIHVRQ
jgi:hypothetical protein